jgi:hypothetical protein
MSRSSWIILGGLGAFGRSSVVLLRNGPLSERVAVLSEPQTEAISETRTEELQAPVCNIQ